MAAHVWLVPGTFNLEGERRQGGRDRRMEGRREGEREGGREGEITYQHTCSLPIFLVLFLSLKRTCSLPIFLWLEENMCVGM